MKYCSDQLHKITHGKTHICITHFFENFPLWSGDETFRLLHALLCNTSYPIQNIFFLFSDILVMKSFFFICLLISLIGDSAEQISFSTDWGSGKRSFLESYENICKSKLEQSLIFDIASLVQVSRWLILKLLLPFLAYISSYRLLMLISFPFSYSMCPLY